MLFRLYSTGFFSGVGKQVFRHLCFFYILYTSSANIHFKFTHIISFNFTLRNINKTCMHSYSFSESHSDLAVCLGTLSFETLVFSQLMTDEILSLHHCPSTIRQEAASYHDAPTRILICLIWMLVRMLASLLFSVELWRNVVWHNCPRLLYFH